MLAVLQGRAVLVAPVNRVEHVRLGVVDRLERGEPGDPLVVAHQPLPLHLVSGLLGLDVRLPLGLGLADGHGVRVGPGVEVVDVDRPPVGVLLLVTDVGVDGVLVRPPGVPEVFLDLLRLHAVRCHEVARRFDFAAPEVLHLDELHESSPLVVVL